MAGTSPQYIRFPTAFLNAGPLDFYVFSKFISRILEVLDSNLEWDITVLIEMFPYCTHSLQANAVISPENRPRPHLSQLTTHCYQTVRPYGYMVRDTDIIVK
jgi:hypothetical protein